MSSPTISDVALAAGVSTATVSRVLIGKTVVAEETRRAVLSALDLGATRGDGKIPPGEDE